MIYLPLMWACVVLFMFRVLGQVYVALYAPRWLPPMGEWYSGLLPYYLLLPALDTGLDDPHPSLSPRSNISAICLISTVLT